MTAPAPPSRFSCLILEDDPAFATLRVDSFRADQDRDRAGGIAFVAGNGDLFTDEERGGHGARAGDRR